MGDDRRVTFATEAADTVVSQQLQAAFFAEIGSRYPGWEPDHSQSAEASDFAPPTGAWIVVYLDGVAVAAEASRAPVTGSPRSDASFSTRPREATESDEPCYSN